MSTRLDNSGANKWRRRAGTGGGREGAGAGGHPPAAPPPDQRPVELRVNQKRPKRCRRALSAAGVSVLRRAVNCIIINTRPIIRPAGENGNQSQRILSGAVEPDLHMRRLLAAALGQTQAGTSRADPVQLVRAARCSCSMWPSRCLYWPARTDPRSNRLAPGLCLVV